MDLLQKLKNDVVICAEGYLFELERRGYVQAGAFVPEVVLEHPEAVRGLHLEFARAGSDVMLAFTYYAHREKMKLVGREGELESINKQALQIAKDAAEKTNTFFAGDICNTNIYDPADQKSKDNARAIFEEQAGWAKDMGVDFIIAETISYTGEALLALKAIKEAGLTAVINLAVGHEGETHDGDSPAVAAKKLEEAGADVVGLNCLLGPTTMLPQLSDIKAAVNCPIAALPVPYRTSPAQPTFQLLEDVNCPCEIPENRPFPTALDPFTCSRYEVADFAKSAHEAGVQFLGLCCGAAPHHIRAMAEALGRKPAASKYSPDLSKHFALGTDTMLNEANKEIARRSRFR